MRIRAAIAYLLMAAFWFCTFCLLVHYFGPTADGGGVMPSFWWSFDRNWRRPLPSLQEFDSSRMMRLAIFLPYWIAAGLFSLAGMLTVKRILETRVALSRYDASRRSAWQYIVAILAITAISDIGIHLHLWYGPALFTSPSGPATAIPFLAWSGLMAALTTAILIKPRSIRGEAICSRD